MATVVPYRIVFTRPICDYCYKEETQFVPALGYLHGIKVCSDDEHFKNAERDVKAWFHIMKLVLIEDVLKLYDLQKSDLLIPRTDGSVTSGGKLIMSDLNEHRFIRKTPAEDCWAVNVSFDKLQKEIDITKLWEAELLTNLLEHLERGFYKEEYEESLLVSEDEHI